MNPENHAWQLLVERAAAQLRGDFADRVLREVRRSADNASSLLGQVMLSAATVVLCFLAIALFQARTAQAEDNHSLTDWQQIATTVNDSSLYE